jgi:3,5-dihydroxyphenylacetyl-CoA synthase
MFLIGLGTAVPERGYSQRECWDTLRATPRFRALKAPSRVLLERVLLGESGIRTRHLALRSLDEAFELEPDVLHRRFFENAPALATRAAQVALERAGIAAREVDALLISTCTGYLCPGLTSYVAERLGLRADIVALDLVGQGCGAALPNLRTGAAYLDSKQCATVLSICVEVCSAALYIDDDPGVLVSACLFGDGAAAAVLSAGPRGAGRSVEWTGALSVGEPADREALRMETRGGLLRNILSRAVPAVAARHAHTLFLHALEERGLSRKQINTWIWHAGGRTVLDRVRDTLELDESELAWSREMLARYGNLSSPFVLFVLEEALRRNAPGGWWWMSSFGAGFSCHGAFLKVA